MAEPARQALSLLGVTMDAETGGYRPLTLATTAGTIPARLYSGSLGGPAVLWVLDGEGSQAEFAHALALAWQARDVSSLVLGYRDALDGPARVLDALVAAHVLRAQDPASLAVVGLLDGVAGAHEVARSGVIAYAAIAPQAPQEASPALYRRWEPNAPLLAEELTEWLLARIAF